MATRLSFTTKITKHSAASSIVTTGTIAYFRSMTTRFPSIQFLVDFRFVLRRGVLTCDPIPAVLRAPQRHEHDAEVPIVKVFTSRSFKSVGGNLAVLTGADLATLAEEFDALASKTTSIHQPNVARRPVGPKEEQKLPRHQPHHDNWQRLMLEILLQRRSTCAYPADWPPHHEFKGYAVRYRKPRRRELIDDSLCVILVHFRL